MTRSSLLDDLVELLLPLHCAACGGPCRGPGIVCGTCWSRLPLLPSPRCDRCGHPRQSVPDGGFTPCRWCPLLPPWVRAARSVCWERPGTTAERIVYALKYGGWPRVAGEMAARMARLDWPRDVVEERAAVVPVPLGSARHRERGYNQSELLARALASCWNIPCLATALVRVRETTSQTRLTPGDRLRNVSGAFRVSTPQRETLQGAHIVLADDVVTTAATLKACAAALCEGGARIVSLVTFARAPAVGDRG